MRYVAELYSLLAAVDAIGIYHYPSSPTRGYLVMFRLGVLIDS
jgi:hypothetical protein